MVFKISKAWKTERLKNCSRQMESKEAWQLGVMCDPGFGSWTKNKREVRGESW